MMREGDYDGAREVCATAEGAMLSSALRCAVRGCRDRRRVKGQPCPRRGRTRPRFAAVWGCTALCDFVDTCACRQPRVPLLGAAIVAARPPE